MSPRALRIAAAGACWLLLGCSDALSGEDAPARTSERVAAMLAEPRPLERARQLAALFAELPPAALPGVLEAYRGAALDGGDLELVLLAIWWAGFDPEAARDWTTREWRASYGSVYSAVFRVWAQRDPRAAWTAAQSLRFAGQRELASDAVIAGWDEGGQPGLVRFVAELPGPELRQRIAEVLARRRLVELGVKDALAWADALESPEFRAEMRARVAGAAAWQDPARTARWAEPHIRSAERPTGLARRIGTRWVRSDPEAAMAWLATLPAGGDRVDGVTESFRDWLAIDRAAATAWIEAQPRGGWLEPALGLHARSTVAAGDPEAALALAAEFEDDTLRLTTQSQIARSWLQRDAEAAGAWLERSGLPEDAIRRIRMLPPPEVRERRRARAAERQEQRAEVGYDMGSE